MFDILQFKSVILRCVCVCLSFCNSRVTFLRRVCLHIGAYKCHFTTCCFHLLEFRSVTLRRVFVHILELISLMLRRCFDILQFRSVVLQRVFDILEFVSVGRDDVFSHIGIQKCNCTKHLFCYIL